MRLLNGKEFLQIKTWVSASSALESCPEYEAMWSRFDRSIRGRKKPGQKLLCYAHTQGLSGEIRLTHSLAKAAGTSLKQLYRAYPSSWYVIGVEGVSVRFPAQIDWSEDLREFHYCGVGVA